MSLLFKRVFPQAKDFEGNVKQLHATLSAAEAGRSHGQNANERFTLLMDHGVTIFLPGEEPDPWVCLMDSTPFVARFGQSAEGEEIEPAKEEKARTLLKAVFRSILKRMRSGARLEVLPERYWQLMQNNALAAELVGEDTEGGLLIEERLGEANKPLPDAVYCLMRLDQHSFLADLLEDGDASGESIDVDFGDISLNDLTDHFGGGEFGFDTDDEDDEPWR